MLNRRHRLCRTASKKHACSSNSSGAGSSRHLMLALDAFCDSEDILGVHFSIDGVVFGHQLLHRESPQHPAPMLQSVIGNSPQGTEKLVV